MAKKSGLLSILKTAIPLVIGLALVYYMLFVRMLPEERAAMLTSMKKANYWWIGFSLVLGILSHASRAYRWKFTLEALGHKPKILNSFYSVMIGYMMNLLVPRMGEVSRCAYFSRYEQLGFDKTLGTVIAERIADALILLSLIIVTLFLQYDVLYSVVKDTVIGKVMNNPGWIVLLAVLGTALFYVFIKLLQRTNNPFMVKIRGFVMGLIDGVKSIMKMKKKGAFLLHTGIIWLLYVVMFLVCFNAVDGLDTVSINGKMAGFVIGGIAVATTNGGLGAYPIGVASILSLYGIDEVTGGAFGWIVWSSQTLMLLVVGLLSLLLINVYNRNETHRQTQEQAL